jgi:SanA protein
MKKGFATVGLIIMMLLSMPFASSLFVRIQAADEMYENIDEAPITDIGLILGAAAYGNNLSDILKDRMDTGIELYNKGKVSSLILSGAENEASAMKKYALDKGVPESVIVEDPIGINTMASIQNLKADGKKITIITQKYHLPRALFIAGHYGIDAVGVEADRHEYAKIIEFKKREIMATTKAMLDMFVLSF